ncbi:MAG TPA: type II toxin-antitoxin system PemK/MazF family toxin [Gemmataceae bacterium]|nr:type II toxin-antitoxin system PemK/MazF family toxin [Gemmataceae bacterium]
MPLPDPYPGLVICYAHLWYDQHRLAQEEGSKDRPCVVVLSVTSEDGDTAVTVAPITRTPPKVAGDGVEIPTATGQRLGLDGERSWVIVTEVNRFHWPGPDLRQVHSSRPGTYEYGFLSPGLFRQVRAGIVAAAKPALLKTAPR